MGLTVNGLARDIVTFWTPLNAPLPNCTPAWTIISLVGRYSDNHPNRALLDQSILSKLHWVINPLIRKGERLCLNMAKNEVRVLRV